MMKYDWGMDGFVLQRSIYYLFEDQNSTIISSNRISALWGEILPYTVLSLRGLLSLSPHSSSHTRAISQRYTFVQEGLGPNEPGCGGQIG